MSSVKAVETMALHAFYVKQTEMAKELLRSVNLPVPKSISDEVAESSGLELGVSEH